MTVSVDGTQGTIEVVDTVTVVTSPALGMVIMIGTVTVF